MVKAAHKISLGDYLVIAKPWSYFFRSLLGDGNRVRYSSIRPRSVRLPANFGPATAISPASWAFSPRIAASMSPSRSVALGPTDFSERDTTHFGWRRHTAAKS